MNFLTSTAYFEFYFLFLLTALLVYVSLATCTPSITVWGIFKETLVLLILLDFSVYLFIMYWTAPEIHIKLAALCVVTIGIVIQAYLIGKKFELYDITLDPIQVKQLNATPIEHILEWTSLIVVVTVLLVGIECFIGVVGYTSPLKYRDTVYKENVSLTGDCGFSELLLSDIVRLNCELAWSRNTWDDLTAFNKKYGAVRMLTIPVDSTIKLSEGTTFEIDDSVKWDVIYGPLYCIPSADVTTQYEVTVEQASASYTTNIRFKEEGTYIFVAHPRELNNTEWEETFILDVVSRDWL